MINHAHELLPETLIPELTRLYREDPEWVEFQRLEPPRYQARIKSKTWVTRIAPHGQDVFGMWANSCWLALGPKIARPSAAQCEALENVCVNIPVADYSQPYPALLVDLPDGRYPPFKAVLCHHLPHHNLLNCQLLSPPDHEDDIVTTVALDGQDIEKSLVIFDKDCLDVQHIAPLALRVAVNLCLAMVHYGCHADYLLPKEVAVDRHYAREQSERGRKAQTRLPLALLRVSFRQEVELSRKEAMDGVGPPRMESSREVSCHWRKGHWRRTPCGKDHSDRRLTFIKPVLVRADKFIGEGPGTVTVYT